MRITTKGQVTIPRRIREILDITPETEVDFIKDNGRVYIVKTDQPQPTQKFKKLRGIATATSQPMKSCSSPESNHEWHLYPTFSR